MKVSIGVRAGYWHGAKAKSKIKRDFQTLADLHPHWEVAADPDCVESHHQGGDKLDHLVIVLVTAVILILGGLKSKNGTAGSLEGYYCDMVLLILWQIFTCNTVRYFFHHRYGLGIISLNYIPHWCHSCHSYQRPRFHLHDRHPKDISTWRSPPEWKERSKSTWSHGHSSWRKHPDHVRLYFTWLADDQWSWHGGEVTRKLEPPATYLAPIHHSGNLSKDFVLGGFLSDAPAPRRI